MRIIPLFLPLVHAEHGHGGTMQHLAFFIRYLVEFLLLFYLCVLGYFGVHLYRISHEPEAGLQDILRKGVLSVVTRNSLHTYYTYEGKPAGFDYDLLKAFADYLNVDLDIRLVDGILEMQEMLSSGEAVLAFPGSPVSWHGSLHTRPYMQMSYQLITDRNKKISSLTDLAGMSIYLPPGAHIADYLRELQEDGLDFKVMEDWYHGEDLYKKVHLGELEAAILPGHIAKRYHRYYPNASPSLALGNNAPFTWIIQPGHHKLRYQLNRFLERMEKDGSLEVLYSLHYNNLDLLDYVELIRFHARLETRLPAVQAFFEKSAAEHGFDWRLIAAQSYQESHFNTWARSHAGARGLMQLMPRTAKSLGVTNIHDPAENVDAGVRHLKDMHRLFAKAEEPDRTYLALAAYNAGRGHLLDAIALARDMELEPYKWSSLEKTLPLLEMEEYHQGANYGYCRGSETVKYLRQILIYYDILKHKGLAETHNLPPE